MNMLSIYFEEKKFLNSKFSTSIVWDKKKSKITDCKEMTVFI